MSKFGVTIRKLRKEKDLSQKQLADILNVSRSTISNYEKNKRLPDLNILCQIAQYFDVTTDYLVGRTKEKNTFYQQINHNNAIITFIVNPDDASFVDCNLSAVDFFAYSKDNFLKMKVYETTVSSKEKVMNNIKEVLQEKQKDFFTQHVTAKGDIKDVHITISPFKVENKILLYCVLHDLTKYKNENRKLSKTIYELIELIGDISSIKLNYKREHQKKVAKIAVTIGEKMGLSEERINILRISSLLHDLGEAILPKELINKPDRLSDIEYNLIKQHPIYAYNLLKDITYLKDVAEIILQHHERQDGSGYPKNLKGHQIILEAKILAVADTIESMTSQRSYRPALRLETALRVLSSKKNTKYDSKVVDACIEIFG